MVVVSDLKKAVVDQSGNVTHFEAEILSANDFYVGHAPMPGRSFNARMLTATELQEDKKKTMKYTAVEIVIQLSIGNTTAV